MFRLATRRLAIGAYAMFMVEQKHNPKLKGLQVAERGKMTSKLYNALSPADKAALQKRAAAQPSHSRKAKGPNAAKGEKKKSSPRAPSAYAKFVKDNIGRFEKLPHRDRMTAVAKLWKQHSARQQK